MARAFVQGAAANMQAVLVYYNNRNKDVQVSLNNITRLSERIEDCRTIEALMAIEGNMRDAYYNAFNVILIRAILSFKGVTGDPHGIGSMPLSALVIRWPTPLV